MRRSSALTLLIISSLLLGCGVSEAVLQARGAGDATAPDAGSQDVGSVQTLAFDDVHRNQTVNAYTVLHGWCTEGFEVQIAFDADIAGPTSVPCVDGRFHFALITSGLDRQTVVGVVQELLPPEREQDEVTLSFRTIGFNQRALATGLGGTIEAIAVEQGTGRVLVGGSLTLHGAQTTSILRFNPDGSLDDSFAPPLVPDAGGWINAIALDSAGRIYVGGDDMTLSGVSGVRRLVRLLPSGAFDASFDNGAPSLDSAVLALAYDGVLDRLYAGGWFSTHRSSSTKGIVRLMPDGARDSSFSVGSGFDSEVERIVLIGDHVFVVGWFNFYAGTGSNKIARLMRDGSIDAAFTSPLDVANRATAVAADDSLSTLFIGGDWFQLGVNGYSVNLVRATLDGALQPDFDIEVTVDFSADVRDVIFDPQREAFYIGGGFAQYGDDDYGHVAAMDRDGRVDPRFLPGLGFDDSARALLIDATRQRLYVGGHFGDYNGTPVAPLTGLDLSGSLLP